MAQVRISSNFGYNPSHLVTEPAPLVSIIRLSAPGPPSVNVDPKESLERWKRPAKAQGIQGGFSLRRAGRASRNIRLAIGNKVWMQPTQAFDQSVAAVNYLFPGGFPVNHADTHHSILI